MVLDLTRHEILVVHDVLVMDLEKCMTQRAPLVDKVVKCLSALKKADQSIAKSALEHNGNKKVALLKQRKSGIFIFLFLPPFF